MSSWIAGTNNAHVKVSDNAIKPLTSRIVVHEGGQRGCVIELDEDGLDALIAKLRKDKARIAARKAHRKARQNREENL